ncbi:condensin-2 complex subunit H2-like [Amphiura filiformis]|uniref:condensin-2 complex subunit H2-like n=1 Tax=Amphiura filiformis TaxID=82378 RepID=UPI003B21B0EC
MPRSPTEMEKRFGHLLQPIRDLTKNWEVDIAAQLEEYLTEIETIKISFDGGSTTMNFAEAALLIQGSACIYSKKVEYLYALVYQTLDLLASKKRLQQATSLDAEGRDKDAEFQEDKEAEFLSLDDMDEAKNIDMKELDMDINMNVVKILTRTPLSLMKLTEPDQDLPLVSRKGEVFGKKSDFRLNTSVIHGSGALILDLSHLSRLEESLRRHPMSTPVGLLSSVPTQINLPNSNDEMPFIPDDDQAEPLGGDISLDDVEMGDPLDESMDDIHAQPQAMERELRPRRVIEMKSEAKPVVDPWAPMDPHEPCPSSNKLFKKGCSFRIPSSVDSIANKKRKRKRIPEKANQSLLPLTEFINKAYFSTSSKLPQNILKKPLFEEYEHFYYKSEFKKQQDVVKKEKEIMAQQGRYQELEEKEEEEAKEMDQPPPTDVLEDGVSGGGDDFDFAGPEPVDDDNDVFGMADYGNEDRPSDSQQEIISSYEDLVRKHVDAYIASAQQYAQVTDLSKRVQQWEDKIMPILKREEKFGYFDIHEYGAVVLDKLEKEHIRTNNDEPVSFKKVIEDKEIFHVSRLFLSSLQLANNYNLDVSSQGEGQVGIDTMALRLLNKKQINEELADFRAPSVQSPKKK